MSDHLPNGTWKFRPSTMTIGVPPATSLTPTPQKNHTSQVLRIYHRRTTWLGFSVVLMIIWAVVADANKIVHTSGYSSLPNDLRPPVDECEWNINFFFLYSNWNMNEAYSLLTSIMSVFFLSCPLVVSSGCPTSTSGVFLVNLQKWRQHHSNNNHYPTKYNSNGNTNYHNWSKFMNVSQQKRKNQGVHHCNFD